MNVVVTQTAINASVSDQNISTSLTEFPISVVASYLGISASLTQTQINASISQGQVISIGLAQSPISIAVSSGLTDAPSNGLTYGRNNGAWVNITGTGGGGSSLPVADTQTIIMGSSDPTKLLRFEVDGFTAGATRVLTPPNQDILLAGQNFLNVFTVNQQMNAHLAVGANSNVSNPGKLLYIENFRVALSMEEEFSGSTVGLDYIEGVQSYTLVNPSDSSSVAFYSIDTQMVSLEGNTREIGILAGVYGFAEHNADGNIDFIEGLEYYASNNNGGDVGAMYGIFVGIFHDGSGLVSEMYGNYIAYFATGDVTTVYGLYIDPIFGGAASSYAIYTNAGLVRFGGIVNTTESYQVDGTKVVGNRVVDARCDDAINSGDATTDGVIDALRDAMIAHGLIAAA